MENGYGNWVWAGANIVLFLYFLKSVFKPVNKTDWTTYKSMGAFFVALFAEMYGFPLTIYILSAVLGPRVGLDLSHNSGHLWEVLFKSKIDPHLSFLHLAGNILVGGGFLMVASAWKTLYEATQKGILATWGLYKYLRHPQYAGFSLIILGFLLQWPTLPTLIMAPILWWRYYRLAKTEEKDMQLKFGKEYASYSSNLNNWSGKVNGWTKRLSGY